MTDKKPPRWPQGTKPAGAVLAITGAIIIVVFGAYLIVMSLNGATVASPVWIGIVFGLAMVVYGTYRRLRGPGALDFPEEGGTHAKPRD